MVQVNSHPSYTNNKECQFLYNILDIIHCIPGQCFTTRQLTVQQLWTDSKTSRSWVSKSTLNFRSDTVTCSSPSFPVLLDENLVYYVESPFHDAAVHTAWDWQGQGLKVKNTSCLQLNNKWHKPDLKERCSCRRSDQCYITALFKKCRLNLLFPFPPGAARDLFPFLPGAWNLSTFPAWSGRSFSLQRPITLKISTSDVNANVWS